MKTTVNLGTNKRLNVEPLKNGGNVLIEIQARDAYHEVWETRLPLVLSEDQAGVLIFGIEQAFEAIMRDTIRKAAEPVILPKAYKITGQSMNGVRCHDGCAGGQMPCPSPKACGVAA